MNIEKAKALVDKKINELRKKTPVIEYDCKKLAEVEINKFFYGGRMIDRVMIVLRSNGCEHYKKTGGCSMCSHFNGTPINGVVTTENYIKQWDSIIDGSQFETYVDFNLNDYPVVCIYNLGSFFNENEISKEAARYIFSTLNNYKNVEKAIVESRAEYVTDDAISTIKSVYDNIIEFGIGVESTNMTIRELCHHKGIEDMSIYKKTVDTLHVHGCKALAYVNLKPVFLTEQEAIDDAVKTCIDCIDMGFDAISIEPTSLQNYSLANYMFELGVYRVPWLWSIREIIDQIYEKTSISNFDIRIGGYFDEEVLSGSQGVGYEKKNELFPHLTSSNCSFCTNEFVERIKKFNATYDLSHLHDIPECPHCYELYQSIKLIRDSRSIEQRIFDAFSDEEF